MGKLSWIIPFFSILTSTTTTTTTTTTYNFRDRVLLARASLHEDTRRR